MKTKILLILSLMLSGLSAFSQLIIDHRHTNISSLSESEINLAKSTLHIIYGHTSHGSQITYGLSGLVGFANGGGKNLNFPTDFLAWNYDGWDGALDLRDGDGLPNDVGYYPDWYNATISYLGQTDNFSRNVFMWSWCGQVDDKYAAGTLFSEYIQPMSQLETLYPNVKFVYMTGHLDHWDDANNKAANDSIRRYCQREKKILYDFADIESYDPDGTYFPYAGDDCSYYNQEGEYLGNWATEWRASHTENVDWYDCYAAHSDALNGNQKAYAAWRMFVEIAKLITLENIPLHTMISDSVVHNGESACFNAIDTLTLTGTIGPVALDSGSTVNGIAGRTIRLLPGFHAAEGCYFSAVLTSDSSFCNMPEKTIPQKTQPVIGSLPETTAQKIVPTDKRNSLQIRVYPNPNHGQFVIETNHPSSKALYVLFDLNGRRIAQTTGIIGQSTYGMNVPEGHSGIYLLKSFDENSTSTRKVIIK